MRMLRLELKRLYKTRLNVILLLLSLLLSVLFAYLPTTWVSYLDRDEETGEAVWRQGLEAVQCIRRVRSQVEGPVMPDTLQKAMNTIRPVLEEYEAAYLYALPSEVFFGAPFLYEPFYSRIQESVMDPDTGLAPGLLQIDPDQETFYLRCDRRLEALLKLEQGNYPSAQAFAQRMYEKVNKPFSYYDGVGTESMDYLIILIFVIAIFGAATAAPAFSSDRQTGAEEIWRAAKHGRLKLGAVKLLAAALVVGGMYLLCTTVYLVVCNSLFGWKSLQSSLQILYSISSLPALDMGGLEIAVTAGGFLSLLSLMSFVLFLSARQNSVASSMALSFLACVLPMLAAIVLPDGIGDWVRCLLPGGGIGLQNSFLYELVDLHFLHVGQASLWTPYVLLIAAAAQVPLFFFLALFSYCGRRR